MMLAILADTAEHVTTWPEAFVFAVCVLTGPLTIFLIVRYSK